MMKIWLTSTFLGVSLLVRGGADNSSQLQPNDPPNQLATLRGLITEARTGLPTACTVVITAANGKVVTERDSFRSGFRCAGTFVKQLPAGPTKIRVFRGLETAAIDRELDLRSGQATDLQITLERSVDLRAKGWFAGDSHAHMIHGERTIPVDFDFVALTARAEDLQYLSLSHVWQLQNPTPELLEAELNPRSTPACVLTWNLEEPKNYYLGDAGRCLGHCWTLAMRGRTEEGRDVIPLLLEASAWDYESQKPPYTNFESHNLIRAQGGAVFYTHPARWWFGAWGGQGGYPKQDKMRVSNMAVELPLDTLIGPTFDGLDVLTGDGELEANNAAFELWALLLNHGYRVAATASSDACFDRPGGAVPGTARIYASLSGGFSLSAVAAAMAAGKTFATTGPLLVVAMDQQPPGSAFRAGDQPYSLAIEAWASGKDPKGLTRLELLRNGKRFQEWILSKPAPAFQTNLTLRESQSAWYCVRAFGGDAQRQKAVSGAFFFDERPYQAPVPVRPFIRVRLSDAATGQPLSGTLTEITCYGTISREGRQHPVIEGEASMPIPGTARLRAEVAGYSPVTLSPILDNPPLIKTITSLNSTDLVQWETFERIRDQLAEVQLNFKMMKNR